MTHESNEPCANYVAFHAEIESEIRKETGSTLSSSKIRDIIKRLTERMRDAGVQAAGTDEQNEIRMFNDRYLADYTHIPMWAGYFGCESSDTYIACAIWQAYGSREYLEYRDIIFKTTVSLDRRISYLTPFSACQFAQGVIPTLCQRSSLLCCGS